ncbi:site-specific integrase [Methylocystis sp. ATCC 49242]|uniref:tyrosine-type recombinase/integrase n=1 Tax=Methylocystis sp. ATCC 49242 TaxID=622637 RepID=UPI001FCA9AFA|nr:site-specific integrase [Methylocystis sp. ATCC 49242]
MGATPPWVRIPPLPPAKHSPPFATVRFSLFFLCFLSLLVLACSFLFVTIRRQLADQLADRTLFGGRLNARKVSTAAPGEYADGGGLYLRVAESGSRTWVYRFSWQGRRPEMGLGAVADGVGLADARAARDEARKLVRAGINPIEARRDAKRAGEKNKTFGAVADDFVAAKSPQWRNEKHLAQWAMTLEKYAAPIRHKPVDEITTEDVLTVLQPLWATRPETASRLRGRIESVLDAAKALGLREGENPARWRGHLSHLLPKRQKLARGHHAAMPYAEVPAFVRRLREHRSASALALEFCILTAARTGEVIGAQWGEIDMAGKVWTVPAARMKAARPHRIPLSGRATAILEKLHVIRFSEYVFPGQRRGKPLSNMAMEMVLRRMCVEDATVHGFRSAFRDWAGNETHFPREIVEAALAHVVGDKAEQAYRRGDALEKRRALMDAWSAFCEAKEAGGAEVIAFKRSGE